MTSISVDLDTLDDVRYKTRSFLVGEPTIENNSIQLDVSKEPYTDHITVVGGRTRLNPQPSTARVGAATYIPAYRLFETKKYNGPLDPLGTPVPSTDQLTVVGGRNPQCCICLNNIRKGSTVVSMPLCGHLYHKACLFNWVDLSKNTFCPYCRQDDF